MEYAAVFFFSQLLQSFEVNKTLKLFTYQNIIIN